MLGKKRAFLLFLLAVPALGGAVAPEAAHRGGTVTIDIGPKSPPDIPGGAAKATLSDAARFAWREFFALNWPAAAHRRDTPDPNQKFGPSTVPLVWQTFRNKVEIYPGMGGPHGFDTTLPDLGYNEPPRYIYSDKPDPSDPSDNPGVGGPYPNLTPGEVPACDSQAADTSPAWVNLDEATQIGLDSMFAGFGPPGTPGQQFLFLAKANHVEYEYVVPKHWYDGVNDAAHFIGTLAPIAKRTAAYVVAHQRNPPSNSSRYVSFPAGTIEVKSAWRQLTPAEQGNGRWVTATARYYLQANGFPRCWREGTFGLAALHIIQKTRSAPYFIFATFGQADNIRNEGGPAVENDDGYATDPPTPPLRLDPTIVSQNATSANPATLASIQHLTPATAHCPPGSRLFYQNSTTAPATPQGQVCVDQRLNAIPAEVIAVNQQAHAALATYLQPATDSPWLHYKLINVQYKPIDKPVPGQDYAAPDAATYYLANEVVETDYNLQRFSGRFQPSVAGGPANATYDLITDYDDHGLPFHNVYAAGKAYDMGGCMGCHGNVSLSGTDFSFILFNQRTFQPDPATGAEGRQLAIRRYLAPLLRDSPVR